MLVCLDGEPEDSNSFGPVAPGASDRPSPGWTNGRSDMVMLVGTGGTTGRPKGVMFTGRNLGTMSALTLMSYPSGRPVYLALAPFTHAAGVLCFPVMTLGGAIVVMRRPDLAEFLGLGGQTRSPTPSCRRR